MAPLPAYPELLRELTSDRLWGSAGLAFRYFDYGATLLWAQSGALLAVRRRYDFTGIFAIALASATGGGLLRDAVFLQVGPPALVRTPVYVTLTCIAAVVAWAFGGRLARGVPRAVTLMSQVADALGLGAFAVVGMRLSLAASLSVPGAMLVGVVNAVGGSVLRSLLLRRTPEVFRPGELTALAALIGTCFYAALTVFWTADHRWAGISTVALVAAVRFVSVKYRLLTRPARGFSLPPPRRANRKRAPA